jgi:hypothetical protein
MWRVVVLAFVELWIGCAKGFPAAPRDGGPAWTELVSAHFTVWTDGDLERARALIVRLEDLRQVTIGVAYPTAPTTGRALAIVVANDAELREVNNLGEDRAFTETGGAPFWQPHMVMSLAGNKVHTVEHELTHLVSSAVVHHQPRWLAEGMAEYFETLALDASRTRGTLDAESWRYGRMPRPAPARELFGWGAMSTIDVESTLYATAWALFAFLLNEHATELSHYLWLVDRIGDPANGTWQQQQQRAWDKGFPSLPLDAVDDKLRKWLFGGSHTILRFAIKPRDWPITAHRLSDGDAYAIRAAMFGGPRPVQQARGRVELEAALATEPLNVLAWVQKVAQGGTLEVPVAKAIAAAHPDDWRAWWLVARALNAAGVEVVEIDEARSKACQLIDKNPALVPPPDLCPVSSTQASQ